MTRIEDDLLDTLSELEKIWKIDVILIFFNPTKRNPLRLGDEDSLYAYIRQLNAKRIRAIVYGSGGNAKAGCSMAEMLFKHFDYYDIFVPYTCASALCYFVLLARKLIMTDLTNITQIDPIAEFDGEEIRLIRALQDKDPEISSQAKMYLNQIRDTIPQFLCYPHSIINKKEKNYCTDEENIQLIVDLMLNKEEHASKITYQDMIKLKFLVEFQNDKKVLAASRNMVKNATKLLTRENKLLLITSTRRLANYKERILMKGLQDNYEMFK